MKKIKTSYQCDECLEVHEREGDAQECCPPWVREVYLCPECKNTHYEEVDAAECCSSDDAEDSAPIASAPELEEAGQERLPL